MKKTPIPGAASQITQRLSELAENSIPLQKFAEGRLARLPMDSALAEDLVQRAFLSVIMGLETNQGRKPNAHEVASPEAFLNYMKGVVTSLLDGMLRQREFHCFHLPLEEEDNDLGKSDWGMELGAPEAVRSQAHLADLKQQLFPRLRSQAHWTLWPTIDAWEQCFEFSDRVPDVAGRHRKYVMEVRKLAAAIIEDLGGIL